MALASKLCKSVFAKYFETILCTQANMTQFRFDKAG